jgi:hypothetical protein
MKTDRNAEAVDRRRRFGVRLGSYLAAASSVGVTAASASRGEVVSDFTLQPFGINGSVPIDFNGDGQTDFEIDHDRIELAGGTFVDFLQLDKNDTNGASLGESPLPINVFDSFDLGVGAANNTFDAAYVIPTLTDGDYPAALISGTEIGPGSWFNFQEAEEFLATGKTIRANRLIDEDAGQVDQVLGGLTPAQVQVPTNGPNFLGLAGETRYLGVRMNLNDAGLDTFGWVGIRITNDADATGEVVGWGYETSGEPIAAGVPEPGVIFPAILAGFFLWRRKFGRKNAD